MIYSPPNGGPFKALPRGRPMSPQRKVTTMYDLSQPNAKPGKCIKCKGTGIYRWGGAVVNGVFQGKEGACHSCRGTGYQDERQIRRNMTYNRHKLRSILANH